MIELDSSVKWRKNGILVNESKSKNINLFNEYVIETLKFRDSGVYECFFNDKPMAKIELRVESDRSKMILSVDDYDLFSKFLKIILSLIAFLVLFLLFLNHLNSYLVKKNLDNIKNSDNQYLNLNNYLKINTEYFEKEVFNVLTRKNKIFNEDEDYDDDNDDNDNIDFDNENESDNDSNCSFSFVF